MTTTYVCVMAELKGNIIDGSVHGLLSKGRELANALGMELMLLALASEPDELTAQLEVLDADLIVVLDDSRLRYYDHAVYSNAFRTTYYHYDIDILLMTHDFVGMDLAPSIGAVCDCSVVTNCVDVLVENGKPIPLKSMYGGKILAKVRPRGDNLLVVSLQPSTKPASNVRRNPRIVKLSLGDVNPATKFIKEVEPPSAKVDLTKAEKIVAIGRGIGDRSNLKIVEEFAKALGAEVGCSRPLVDVGWFPMERLVGISGNTVKPKLYIACGISGASQHLVGMKDAEIIISINKDKNAPIVSYSDYALIGDLMLILPACTNALKQRRA